MNRIDEDLDDLTLPHRPRRPEDRGEVRSGLNEDRYERVTPEREFTLSTGTVLALFFGLALVCAVFFGFGYNMGRKSAATAAANTVSAGSDTASSIAADSTANKPNAGTPTTPQIPSYQGQGATEGTVPAKSTSTAKLTTTASPKGDTVTVPLTESTSTKARTPVLKNDSDGKIVEAPEPPSTDSKPTSSAVGTSYVQVTAVSHQEDANSVVSALKRRGYAVFTRTNDTDKLIHVQLGPFATKKDAEAMRLRLQGDGYNAIVK